MAPTTSAHTKSRKPPTFQHLPEHRARKLKKEWVEKQKIRNKWQAQKKREGIVTLRDARKAAQPEEKEDEQEQEQDEEEVEKEEGADEARASSEDADDAPPAPKPSAPHPARRKRKGDDVIEGEEPSYRELQRQAYSRQSLHHYRSGVGEKAGRGAASHSRGRSQNAPSTSGRGRGRGVDPGRGQRGRGAQSLGQPDMRIRMNALLAKIKHDAEK